MSGEEPATQIAPVESPQMVSTIKLPILKKGEYTLWSMRMEQYLTNTDYSLWQRERKAKSILLLAIPDEYQLRFHAIKDAKTLWAAITSRFSGNVESKKMQKNVLKQQFENFSVSDTEGLDKAYDRNKDGIDDLDIDDLYNNLKVFEDDIKGSSGSSSNSQNVAFLSAEDTSSSNEVNTANGVSTASGHNSHYIKGAILQGNVEHQEIKGTEWRIQGQRLVIVQDGLDMTELYSHDNQLSCSHVPTLTLLRRQTLSKANLEIVAYQLGLESIEAQLVVHQKNEAVYEEKDNGYKAVPLPLTGNYMPPLADLSFAGLDYSVYRPTANKTSASVSQVETSITPPSNTSVEMPRVESVRPSGVIIKDWVSDDEDIFLSNDLQATDKPSFKIIEFTNARNESVKPKQADKPRIITQNPKVDRRDWNGQMTQKLRLGFGFTKKAYFFCGIYSHLIKDCDFHEKKMAKKSVLKNMGKNFGQREIRPVWNSAQRINHQNKFVPLAVLTRSGRVPGNPQQALKNKRIFNSGCFRHMTGNKDFLNTDYQHDDGGLLAVGESG
ncbi:hypothetical protein Tco_0675672 [Tanacetum coccineum]